MYSRHIHTVEAKTRIASQAALVGGRPGQTPWIRLGRPRLLGITEQYRHRPGELSRHTRRHRLHVHPRSSQRELRAHAPKARPSVVLDNCGHWIQQEHPEKVNSLLLEFLSGI
jgi:pimeloyl-ACP methyl ester carboxylesterase